MAMDTLPSMSVITQVKDLQAENQALLRQLGEKDNEIQSLKDVVESATALQSQDVQSAKIIELAKKVRSLNLALEKEKQKSSKLQQDDGGPNRTQSVGVSSAGDDVARGLVEQAAEMAEAAQREAATWKDRMTQQTNKLSQLEQKVYTLESENKKLVRALQREVGEDVPLSKILDEGGDWKGRREQLISLRDQIKQLKSQQGMLSETKHDTAVKRTITKLSKEKSMEMERLAVEATQLKSDNEALKLKHDGLNSRRKILEGEVSSLKDKLMVILEKTENDTKLITALRAELQGARQKGASSGNDINFGQDELWQEISRLRRKCAEQEKQMAQQEQQLQRLQADLQVSMGSQGSEGDATLCNEGV